MSSVEKENTSAAVNDAEQKALKKAKRKRIVKRVFKTVFILILVAAVAFFVYNRFLKKAPTTARVITYTYATASVRDISEELTGSGTLESAASYTLSTRVSGEILMDTFVEGDTVKEGDVLYKIDSSAMDANLERALKSLSQAKDTYDEKLADRKELVITAPISGIVSGLNQSVGGNINSGASLLTIKNISTLTLTEYYSTAFADEIYVGMPATVSVSGQMLNVTGKVTEISDVTRISPTGVICFPVKVEISNPGSLTIGTMATGWLDGDIYPTIVNTDGFEPSAVKVVYAGTAGEIETLKVRNGDIVAENAILAELSPDKLEDEIDKAKENVEDAQLSLDNIYDSIDGYTITAPIDGTVIRKIKKAGEGAESGTNLCMIYDLSYLTVSLSIDELDIKNVSVGQRAVVTADAVKGTEFEGVVTRVGVNGTTSGGVTTYPVDIRIDETDGLLPGMNVDISIKVREARNIVAIPVDAVERNNRVLVKTADGSTGEGTPEGAPEGYGYVTVEIGMADDKFVEIVSGINEGDSVAYISRSITTANGGFGMMGGFGGMSGGMPGGMSGSTRPQGGMSGSTRPQGGMSGSGGNRQQGGMPSGGGFR